MRLAIALSASFSLATCTQPGPEKTGPSPAPVETPAPAATPPPEGAAPATAAPPLPVDAAVAALAKPWKGDFDGMVKRRLIRVLTAYSKTGYFLDGAVQRGTAYDIFQAFEAFINKRLRTTEAKRIHVLMIPVARDQLFPGVVDGRADIASANLTITKTREKLVDFSTPFLGKVSEIAVTARGAPPLRNPEDLAGKEAYVRRSSSYYTSLVHLSEKLQAEGRRPVTIVLADENLEDEDLLEMVNARLIPLTVVDDHIATLWAQVFESIELHPKAAVRTGGEIAAAFRKRSPQLAKALDDFVRSHRVGTTFGNLLLKKYLKETAFVRNAANEEDMQRFRQTVELFRKYAGEYGFDYLMVTAQGYQESRLDQNVRSSRGAIGVMQLLPSTAREMGIPDIQKTESNIHAGVKYLRWIGDNYFTDPAITPVNRELFCFAAYNAGPTRVAGLRRRATAMGLDPNKWFGNVEMAAAREIGRETVQYVGSIYKYYIAYTLILQQEQNKPKVLGGGESGRGS